MDPVSFANFIALESPDASVLSDWMLGQVEALKTRGITGDLAEIASCNACIRYTTTLGEAISAGTPLDSLAYQIACSCYGALDAANYEEFYAKVADFRGEIEAVRAKILSARSRAM